MNKTFRILLCFMLYPCVVLFCQNKEDQLLQQLTSSNAIRNNRAASVSNDENKALITQVGEGHVAVISQKVNSSTSGNEAYIYQCDANNQARVTQSGIDNTTYIEQKGYNNSVELDLLGSSNRSALVQSGINNELVSSLKSDGIYSEVVQNGMNNSLIQKEESARGLSFKVTQTGNGMRVQITNGSIGAVR